MFYAGLDQKLRSQSLTRPTFRYTGRQSVLFTGIVFVLITIEITVKLNEEIQTDVFSVSMMAAKGTAVTIARAGILIFCFIYLIIMHENEQIDPSGTRAEAGIDESKLTTPTKRNVTVTGNDGVVTPAKRNVTVTGNDGVVTHAKNNVTIADTGGVVTPVHMDYLANKTSTAAVTKRIATRSESDFLTNTDYLSLIEKNLKVRSGKQKNISS